MFNVHMKVKMGIYAKDINPVDQISTKTNTYLLELHSKYLQLVLQSITVLDSLKPLESNICTARGVWFTVFTQ